MNIISKPSHTSKDVMLRLNLSFVPITNLQIHFQKSYFHTFFFNQCWPCVCLCVGGGAWLCEVLWWCVMTCNIDRGCTW